MEWGHSWSYLYSCLFLIGWKTLPVPDGPYRWVTCKKDVTPLLTHWSYVFLALSRRYQSIRSCLISSHSCLNSAISSSGEHTANLDNSGSRDYRIHLDDTLWHCQKDTVGVPSNGTHVLCPIGWNTDSSLIWNGYHYSDVIMGAMASQITSLTIFYSTVYSGADQRKHQSSASLAFMRGIHRSPVNSPLKWPVTRKIFPFDDVIMVDWPYIAGGHNHIQQPFTVTGEPFLQYSLDIDIAAHGFCAIYHGPMLNC